MRVVDFSMDGITVKLASMTWAQAEKFVAEGQALLKNADTKSEQWLDRTLMTVGTSLIGAGATSEECTPERLKELYDMPTMNAMYFKILEVSGLAVKQGEAAAA